MLLLRWIQGFSRCKCRIVLKYLPSNIERSAKSQISPLNILMLSANTYKHTPISSQYLSKHLLIDSKGEVQHILNVIVLHPLETLMELFIQKLQITQITWTAERYSIYYILSDRITQILRPHVLKVETHMRRRPLQKGRVKNASNRY